MTGSHSLTLIAHSIAAGTQVAQRLSLESHADTLSIRAARGEWRLAVETAERWFASHGAHPEPVTEITGWRRGAEPVHIAVTVNCGAAPPTFTLRAPGRPNRQADLALAITHHQQDAILHLIEAHLRRNGFAALPSRTPVAA
jgi:hypothetical protein